MSQRCHNVKLFAGELLEEIRDKDLALKKARKTGKDEHWKIARLERNRVGRLVELARRDFFEEEQVNSRGDPKKFWRNVSTVIPNNKADKVEISLIDNSSGVRVEKDGLPNHINDYFANIGVNLAKGFNAPWVPKCPPNLDSEITNISTDFEEVHGLCKDINTSKSSAIELLSSKVMKDAFLVLTLQLVYLFNLSLGLNVFPPKWKIATVIPLYKGGPKTDVGNYRPISLLPLPGKLLEKIVHKKLSLFLERNDLLCDEQCGFRKDRSTTFSIVNLTDALFPSCHKLS